jgi:hydrogenase maturation factor
VTSAERGTTDEAHCITCSDEGIEMTVVETTERGAQCRDPEGIDQHVETEFVEPVGIGDTLLVHAGLAIAIVPRPPGANQPTSS